MNTENGNTLWFSLFFLLRQIHGPISNRGGNLKNVKGRLQGAASTLPEKNYEEKSKLGTYYSTPVEKIFIDLQIAALDADTEPHIAATRSTERLGVYLDTVAHKSGF